MHDQPSLHIVSMASRFASMLAAYGRFGTVSTWCAKVLAGKRCRLRWPASLPRDKCSLSCGIHAACLTLHCFTAHCSYVREGSRRRVWFTHSSSAHRSLLSVWHSTASLLEIRMPSSNQWQRQGSCSSRLADLSRCSKILARWARWLGLPALVSQPWLFGMVGTWYPAV